MTYDGVIEASGALLNDPELEEYTYAVQYPYLNIALSELQEIFELNGIPVTQKSSSVINVPSGITEVTFEPDIPVPGTDYLPEDLVEINEVFESPEDQANWTHVTRKDYLTADIIAGNTETSYFRVWAWQDQAIKLLAANQDNDLMLNYIKSIFPVIDADNSFEEVTILNTTSFLIYRNAGLCAEYLAENPTRAQTLNQNASMALDRTLGISTKGKQAIIYRRRPFRAAWKRRGIVI